MKVFVTGATGFIGRALTQRLLEAGYSVTATVRKQSPALPSSVQQVEIGDLAKLSRCSAEKAVELREALSECEVVIHLAGLAHTPLGSHEDALVLLEKVNVRATLKLAQLAEEAGVTRFIYMSSISVNGNQTHGEGFNETDPENPQEPYALSKYHTEVELINQLETAQMKWVIIRPPLVYGPDALGNFAKLIRLVESGMPIPLGGIRNQRSLIALDNLVNFVMLCIHQNKANNQRFVIADDEMLSTSELLKAIAKGLGRRTFLIPIPVRFMTKLLDMVGRSGIPVRLFGSLTVNNQKAKNLLGWSPVSTVEQQMAKLKKNQKLN